MKISLSQAKNSNFALISDRTLGYEFQYPVNDETGNFFRIVISRRPERYSSAAPLTVNTRQRIVCELLDLPAALSISVSIGPPSGVLKALSIKRWKSREIASCVLIDKYTSNSRKNNVVSSRPDTTINTLERIKPKKIDNQTYWYYEYSSQKFSSVRGSSRNNSRQTLSVSSVRLGLDNYLPYLYSLSVAYPRNEWVTFAEIISKSTNSFRLTTPSKVFVTPEREPWRFF